MITHYTNRLTSQSEVRATMTDGTTEELMGATYRALCKHGYASLRMQDIADESTKSKAALHYHYESKHDLLLSFLEYLYEQFEAKLDERESGDDPVTRLTTFIEDRLTPRDQDSQQEFQTAILEIKSQAPYDAAYRERLTEFDQLIYRRIRLFLDEGIDQGVFRDDIDPDDTAQFLATHINGAQIRHVSVGYPIETSRRRLIDYINHHVLADAAEGTDPE